MKYELVYSALLLALAASSPSVAAPVPVMDVAGMTRDAEVIVAARVTGKPITVATGQNRQLSIYVERVVKGNSEIAGSALQVMISSNRPISSNIQNDSYGLFFLDCLPSNRCVPADASHPSLVALPGHHPVVSMSGISASERVILELVAVLKASNEVLAAPATGLAYLSSKSSSRRAQEVRARAVEALATLPAEVAVPALLNAASSQNVATRLAVTAALVRLGEFSSLSAVEAQMLRPSAELQSDVRQIAQATRSMPSPPDILIAPMTRWLRSSDVEVRRAAASVLSSMRSQGAISPLARIALLDSDTNVRYYAVSGLVINAGDGKAPSIETFKKDEKQYLSTWRNRTKDIDPK